MPSSQTLVRHNTQCIRIVFIMTDKKRIGGSDIDSSESIKRLVHDKYSSVLCFFPGPTPRPEKFQRSVPIVTMGGPEQIASLLANDYLPEHYSPRTTLSQQLNILSTRDGLTGLFNRRYLTIRLMQLLQMAKTDDSELSLLILNIDFFNSINKTAGLEFGDLILNKMAARLTETIDSTATCYRFSSEDFIVLLPGIDLQKSCYVAEKIRKVCSEKPYADGKHSISITISAGVASLKDHKPDNHDEIICMAETALYIAKAEGRNRLQVYHPLYDSKEFFPQRSLGFLKENLSRILDKTRASAIASLQLLAKNIEGSAHQAHITHVSNYMALLGEHVGLPEQQTKTFQNSITLYYSFRFLLHNDLLSKPGKLTGKERKTIEDLPFNLLELTEMFDYFSEERSILLGHTERYDGTGYPLGLKGDEISLGARIFTIVDSLAAMSSERPYREKLSPPEIIEEFKKEAGKQFDPYLVLQILAVIKKKGLLNLDTDFLDQAQLDLLKTFPKLKL